jgi:hypothetical protein
MSLRYVKLLRDIQFPCCGELVHHHTKCKAIHTSHQRGASMSPVYCPSCKSETKIKANALRPA